MLSTHSICRTYLFYPLYPFWPSPHPLHQVTTNVFSVSVNLFLFCFAIPHGSETIQYLSFSNKITADGDCSHEIKRLLLLGRKVMTNLDSILKSRDITLPTKVRLVKTMVFPVVMYGYESWTMKKAEHRTSDAFELWCWRRLWESLELQGDPTRPS